MAGAHDPGHDPVDTSAAGPPSDADARRDADARLDAGATPEAPARNGIDPATALLAQARTDARSRGRSSSTRRSPRPMPPSSSGSAPDDRDPQMLSTAVSRLLAQHGWEVEVAVHAVMARWAELVGPEVAAHCAPERYTEGELVVRTDSTTWATQLRLLAPQLVRRLNVELGDDTVRVVSVRGPDAPRWTHGQRSVRGRGPRDTYG